MSSAFHTIRNGESAMTSARLAATGATHRTIPDRQLFRLTVAVTFPFFLVAALLAAVWPGRTGGEATKVSQRWSLLAQARAASNSTIPFVFMG